jgi:hypothetical protein
MPERNNEGRVERPAHEREQNRTATPGGTVAGRATTVSSPKGIQTSNKPEIVADEPASGSPGAQADRDTAERKA